MSFKQYSEQQQKQVQKFMSDNENSLKINNALLYKTKILEEDIRERDATILKYKEKFGELEQPGKICSRKLLIFNTHIHKNNLFLPLVYNKAVYNSSIK